MRWVVLCGHGRLRRASASHAKLFKDVDLDNDGMIGFREWMRIVELAGNAISADEAEFLFVFWDTHAGEVPPSPESWLACLAPPHPVCAPSPQPSLDRPQPHCTSLFPRRATHSATLQTSLGPSSQSSSRPPPSAASPSTHMVASALPYTASHGNERVQNRRQATARTHPHAPNHTRSLPTLQREQSGAIIIELAISDLLGTEPNYGSYFQAGGAPGVKEPTKNNRSSVEGGIFGGGMYEAESTRDRQHGGAPPPQRVPMQQNIPPQMGSPAKVNKPVNNASSIEGG